MFPASAFWSPYLLQPSLLKAWWSADDVAPGAVATWTDRTNAIATTATSTAQPTAAVNSWAVTTNPQPGVTFDGVANYMSVTPVPAGLPTVAASGEVWAVAANTSVAAAFKSVVRYGAFNTSDRGIVTSNDARQSLFVPGTTTSLFGTGSPALGTTGFIAGGAWTATTLSARLNGADLLPTSTAAQSGVNTSTGRLYIGANAAPTPGHFWQGVTRHVIVIGGRLLTLVERQLLEGYLAWDSWDNGPASPLPSNHPWKYVCP